MEQNPYAAPQVALTSDKAPTELPGWSAGQLSLLGWLSLASTIGSVLGLLLIMVGTFTEDESLTAYSNWLTAATALLGCYLVVRLKSFLEARFAATSLAWPTWLMVLFSLVSSGLNFLFTDDTFARLGWEMFAYFATVVVWGAFVLWYGIVLLRIQHGYPALRVLAWLEIVGGAMMASVILMMLAILPLTAAGVAMMLVCFKGAEELRGKA